PELTSTPSGDILSRRFLGSLAISGKFSSMVKDNKTRLEVKLSRLTELEYENAEGVKELKVNSAIMELCEED
ncbi:hypothetical protein Tco_1574898, partial [Tanacetum coccineum]